MDKNVTEQIESCSMDDIVFITRCVCGMSFPVGKFRIDGKITRCPGCSRALYAVGIEVYEVDADMKDILDA